MKYVKVAGGSSQGWASLSSKERLNELKKEERRLFQYVMQHAEVKEAIAELEKQIYADELRRGEKARFLAKALDDHASMQGFLTRLILDLGLEDKNVEEIRGPTTTC